MAEATLRLRARRNGNGVVLEYHPEDKPVAESILEAADVDPRLDVRLEGFSELKTNQQIALLRYILRLTPGVDVHIIGSQLSLRKLLQTHADLLPASVTERAESGLLGSPDVTTRSEQRREVGHATECEHHCYGGDREGGE